MWWTVLMPRMGSFSLVALPTTVAPESSVVDSSVVASTALAGGSAGYGIQSRMRLPRELVPVSEAVPDWRLRMAWRRRQKRRRIRRAVTNMRPSTTPRTGGTQLGREDDFAGREVGIEVDRRDGTAPLVMEGSTDS
jgi:hypothetical protein